MSVPVTLLGYDDFVGLFSDPMRDVTGTEDALVDIWPYVDAVPGADLEGHVLADVERVYRDGKALYDFVHIATDADQVFLVIAIDLGTQAVVGHHLLDLPRLYSKDGPN